MILRSIISRLVFSYCLLLVLLGAAFMLFTVLSFEHYTRETIASTLRTRAREIWNVSQGSLQQPGLLADIIERRFSPESQDRFIRVRAGDHVIYESGRPESGDFTPQSVPLINPGTGTGAKMTGNLLLFSRNFHDGRAGWVTIDSGQSYQFARAVQKRLAESLFIGLPVLLLLAAIAGYLLMRGALKPVEVMINAAENYSFNDPHNRLPLVGTEPRIEALGLALNRMLDRLDGAYSHVRRFSADAAHELRTPLTIIRGELELVAAQTKLTAGVEQAVSNALEEIGRLTGIVEGLITLSRMGSFWGKSAHTAVDLLALAVETIEQINLLAVEKNITLSKPTGPPVIVAGDRDRLKQVLVNLIDNAIKYTPPGGKVTVETGISGDNGFVSVEDTGIGIDPRYHEKVFDRFYRVVPDRGEQGAGLGLAIVKAICHAHGGTVTLNSVPEFGSVFRVEIPLFSQSPLEVKAERKMAAAGSATATVSTPNERVRTDNIESM